MYASQRDHSHHCPTSKDMSTSSGNHSVKERAKVRVHLHQTHPTLIIIILEVSLDYNPAADIICDNFNKKIFLFKFSSELR